MLFGPTHVPLAERLRPRNLDEYFGQKHLVGEGKILRRVLTEGPLPSMILWGPPGVGKTTLARLVGTTLNRPVFHLSAISSGVKDVREVIARAEGQGEAILFIDEIHRFSKAQQDSLLGAVEKGVVKLIGATTENPSFEVIAALLSRCQVYVLESLDDADLLALIDHAQAKDDWLRSRQLKIAETGALLRLASGDARKVLTLLEIAGQSSPVGATITDKGIQAMAQQHVARFDKGGEQHYDIASAFIKSLRGSDPNAALYWLARLVEGGEDVKFIARRMVILASEDIGNANPTALVLATNTFQAVSIIGYPEARIILAQCATYLAASPKSNASYKGIGAAQAAVQEHGDLPVPLALRNAATKLMKQLGYGKSYHYSHEGKGNFVDQNFLPEALEGTVFFDPGDNPRERDMRERLRRWWKDRYRY